MRFVLRAHLHDLHLAAHDHVELVPRLAGVEELVAGRAGLVAQVAQRAVLRELELEPLEELDAAAAGVEGRRLGRDPRELLLDVRAGGV